jgi:hypothetical protein
VSSEKNVQAPDELPHVNACRGQFIPHDSKLQFGGLKHATAAGLNMICPGDTERFQSISTRTRKSCAHLEIR